MKKRIANFTAGPALKPKWVQAEIDKARRDFFGTGIPLTETSHRKDIVVRMARDTVDLVRKTFGIGDGYVVALVPGGGTEQFKSWILNMVPYPVVRRPRIAFIESDVWATSAMEKKGALDLEKAGMCDIVRIVPPSRNAVRPSVDPEWFRHVDDSCDMAYIVSNGTGGGVQYPTLDNIPKDFKPLVIMDASSDLGSYRFDVKKFAYIFAGTQKCLGIQGITLVIARKDVLVANPLLAGTQSVLVQSSEKNAGGLFNTADVEAIYALNRMLVWIRKKGGLEAMKIRSEARAGALYTAIDASQMFEGLALRNSRSMMNATFRIKGGNDQIHADFLRFCDEQGIEGVNGHDAARKLYGPHFRASLYNGQTMANVRRLIKVMKEFERRS
ncbi:aminotransferase class V-fold PLP-dependent enzyme [Candidatus Kaiserbacteria bacterium]|nr:aminotransferase class V-fold PLP-dependent enzyme [Candidatus Kaiserbacteria bacterium]